MMQSPTIVIANGVHELSEGILLILKIRATKIVGRKMNVTRVRRLVLFIQYDVPIA